MIRLIVSDLDGTLCDEAHGLDHLSASYIKKLQDSNIIFMIATGRDYSVIRPLFHAFDFQCPVIALNGAVCYDENGKKMQEQVLNQKVVNKIASLTSKESLMIWYTSKGNYCTNKERYKQMIHDVIPKPIITRFLREHGYVEFCETLTIQDILKESCVYKIDVFYGNNETIQKLKLLEELEVSSSSPRITEITQKNIHKGNAVVKYCEEYHFQRNEVLAFGDHENDLAMLMEFPYGHIMRNASTNLLERVNYIAPKNTQHGVIKVIENFTNISIAEEVK